MKPMPDVILNVPASLVFALLAGLALSALLIFWRAVTGAHEWDQEDFLKKTYRKEWRDGRWHAVREFKAPPLRPAPARFIGWQGCPGIKPFELYNLTEDIPGHPVESSVSRQTLEAAGFFVPPPPYQFGAAAEERRFLATRRDDEAAAAP